MLIAINTQRNNKLYKSIQVHNDLSLQETVNNRWIAPEYLIEDYGDELKGSEIEFIYLKTKELEIMPYLHNLNKAKENATEVIRLEYERQGILIDNKIEECKKVIEEFKSLTIAGQMCLKCKQLGKIGVINRKKDGSALYCSNFHDSSQTKCDMWVNL